GPDPGPPPRLRRRHLGNGRRNRSPCPPPLPNEPPQKAVPRPHGPLTRVRFFESPHRWVPGAPFLPRLWRQGRERESPQPQSLATSFPGSETSERRPFTLPGVPGPCVRTWETKNLN